MFIVGIDTPDGQATYHYDINPYWDMFKCRVLDNAPEWDGHTPAQAIERIGKLKAQKPCVDAAPVVHGRWRDTGSGQECSVCNEIQYGYDSGRFYCANCGAKMDGETEE